MMELFRESVVQAQYKKQSTGKLISLEHLSEHKLTEGLYCFKAVPDIDKLRRTLFDALENQPGFSATAVSNNPLFLMHRDASAVMFSVCRRQEIRPEFGKLEKSLGACAKLFGDDDAATRPLAAFCLLVFSDGYCALLFRCIHRRADGDICRQLIESWSSRYDDERAGGPGSLFGGMLAYVAQKQLDVTSRQLRAPKKKKSSNASRDPVYEKNSADDFVREIKKKYCAEKYSKSGVQLDRSKLLWIKLRQCFEKEMPYLDIHFDLKTLAERMGVSPLDLNRSVNAYAGVQLGELIDRYRMAKAQALLSDARNAQRNLADIALSSGYASQSRFSAHFKKATGFTPDAWRRMRSTTPARPALYSGLLD